MKIKTMKRSNGNVENENFEVENSVKSITIYTVDQVEHAKLIL